NKLTLLTVLVLSTYLVIGSMFCLAAESGPKIEIVTKDADIGEVKKGGLLDFKVEVKNKGKADLVIEKVYSNCGCFEVTDPRWPGNHETNVDVGNGLKPFPTKVVQVKPGESIFIAIRLDTNKVIGQFEKSLHIISNDPVTKDAVWRIKGTVIDTESALRSPNGKEFRSANGAEVISKDAKLVMLFYTPGCSECNEVREKFLPVIKDKYKDKILIVEYNIDNPEAFAFLIDLQNKYDQRAKKGFFNPKPPAVFIESKFLYGAKEIEKDLDFYIANQ
ncbi:MAG: DUF1573 domain-containing protein, partial [Candidatus Omnitrophota bacterium]